MSGLERFRFGLSYLRAALAFYAREIFMSSWFKRRRLRMDKSIVACSAYIPRTAAITERVILVGETRGGRWNLRNKATHSQFLVHKRGCGMLWKLLFNVHGEFVSDDNQIIWIHHTQ
jgi:hypothetical protein